VRPLARLLLALAGACGTTQLTPQQEWVMALFAECKTRTNAINVKLEQVYPDGRFTASSMQTQSDYNHVVACMQNETVTASLYRKQAEGGSAAAMANLGSMYEEGRGGLTKNDAEAAQWYRRGAEAGSGQAMASLGTMYERGRGGLARNVDEAAQWYRKGADTGDRYAMYCLGHAHEFGVGVRRDRAEAAQWYRKAADKGFTPAAERLKTLGQ
jgi:TPR repeat protein